ncbi:MFS transporter [Sphingomonas metalli]|uniref:MFS transporter n=1 Tax=Sphingomonas metalli TaxID=1779358 RepID=A0A916WTW7_9SPHN|nr:MFS transporter [Sphingomonas metalli]GGB29597.1 MFS transporter [Sphingomonas metalli]
MSRVSRPRLILFAGGDFAFNLYWQSVMLYLLFYYTDALGLPMATAAAIYLAASIWDGIASFAVGALADRLGSARRYRLALVAGAVPLGAAFALAYWPVAAGIGFVLAGHMLFRTAYALVNIPYLAMSARVSADSRDRALVAGLRMLAGTMAAVVVAAGTVPLGERLSGGSAGPPAFFAAALLFAAIGAALLLWVGATFRDAVPGPPASGGSVRAALGSVARNRAFLTLSGAMMAMIVATTMLNKSVLYYFKYFLHDEAAGQLALASMMAVSAAAVPVWMLVARWIGVRRLWFVAVALNSLGLALFALADLPRAGAMQLFLMAMQAATVGLHFAFWAMLPDTVEWGQRAGGARSEGTVFGLAALLQRVAIGLATALLGASFGEAGYTANIAQSPQTLAEMRWTIALVPLGFFLLSGLLMALNPLKPGAHDAVVRELAG